MAALLFFVGLWDATDGRGYYATAVLYSINSLENNEPKIAGFRKKPVETLNDFELCRKYYGVAILHNHRGLTIHSSQASMP